ncbi:MAG: hypothetical protein Q8M19_13650 [Reyranella sp.]|nr:hypothetical protein [Reyranella sp.]
MIKLVPGAALCALLSIGLAPPGIAAERHDIDAVTAVAELLLGSEDEEALARDWLPFTRQFGVSGVVEGSLAASTTSAGPPRGRREGPLRRTGRTSGCCRRIGT